MKKLQVANAINWPVNVYFEQSRFDSLTQTDMNCLMDIFRNTYLLRNYVIGVVSSVEDLLNVISHTLEQVENHDQSNDHADRKLASLIILQSLNDCTGEN